MSVSVDSSSSASPATKEYGSTKLPYLSMIVRPAVVPPSPPAVRQVAPTDDGGA